MGGQKLTQWFELQDTGRNYKNWLHLQRSSGRTGLVGWLVTAERFLFFPRVHAVPSCPCIHIWELTAEVFEEKDRPRLPG